MGDNYLIVLAARRSSCRRRPNPGGPQPDRLGPIPPPLTPCPYVRAEHPTHRTRLSRKIWDQIGPGSKTGRPSRPRRRRFQSQAPVKGFRGNATRCRKYGNWYPRRRAVGLAGPEAKGRPSTRGGWIRRGPEDGSRRIQGWTWRHVVSRPPSCPIHSNTWPDLGLAALQLRAGGPIADAVLLDKSGRLGAPLPGLARRRPPRPRHSRGHFHLVWQHTASAALGGQKAIKATTSPYLRSSTDSPGIISLGVPLARWVWLRSRPGRRRARRQSGVSRTQGERRAGAERLPAPPRRESARTDRAAPAPVLSSTLWGAGPSAPDRWALPSGFTPSRGSPARALASASICCRSSWRRTVRSRLLRLRQMKALRSVRTCRAASSTSRRRSLGITTSTFGMTHLSPASVPACSRPAAPRGPARPAQQPATGRQAAY